MDVLQITHAAISMVSLHMRIFSFLIPCFFLMVSVHLTSFCVKVEGGPETTNDVANTIMQKFWDSALALEPPDEEFDSRRLINASFFVLCPLFQICNSYLHFCIVQ